MEQSSLAFYNLDAIFLRPHFLTHKGMPPVSIFLMKIIRGCPDFWDNLPLILQSESKTLKQ